MFKMVATTTTATLLIIASVCLLLLTGVDAANTCSRAAKTAKVLIKFVPDRFSLNETELQQINLLSHQFQESVVNSTAVRGLNMNETTREAVRNLTASLYKELNITSAPSRKRKRRSVTTKNFCLKRGDVSNEYGNKVDVFDGNGNIIPEKLKETKGRMVMCNMCSQTTDLGENFRPRYINEIVCESDNGCAVGQGLCNQNTVSVLFSKCTSGNRDECQKGGTNSWIKYSQALRVSCECKLAVSSSFRNYIKY